MNDQITGDGMPEAPMPPSSGDDDLVDISNTGQRIRAILVLIVVLAVGGAAFFFYSKKQAEKEKILAVKETFAVVHTNGYEAFWKVSKLDIKSMKTNKDFELRIKSYLKETSVAYSKHLKEKAIPVLAESMTEYQNLEAPAALAPEVKGVANAAQKLLDAWVKFQGQIDMYEGYFKNLGKLDDAADAWFGAQQDPKKEDFLVKSVRYYNLVQCVLIDQVIMDIDATDLSFRVKDTCAIANEQADWFKRVAFGCIEKLSQTDAVPDELYTQTVKKYNSQDPMDAKSKFQVLQCLEISRSSFEEELSNEIAMAWAGYVKAQNSLLNAITKKSKEL